MEPLPTHGTFSGIKEPFRDNEPLRFFKEPRDSIKNLKEPLFLRVYTLLSVKAVIIIEQCVGKGGRGEVM